MSATVTPTVNQRLSLLKDRLKEKVVFNWLREPRAIQVEITNACNLRCKMCPSNSPEAIEYDRNRTLMDIGLYRKIIDEAATFPKCHIIPQGGGEPFLHPEFREMLVMTKQKPNLTIGFVTNGTKARPDDCELLVTLGVEEVVVSVYGHDAESHKRVTGRANYGNVEAFVENLHETRQRRGMPWPRIRVQTVETEEIAEHLRTFVPRWLKVADDVAILARRDITGRGLSINEYSASEHRPCLKIWHETAISSDGEMSICCEDWNAAHAIGNIRKMSIRDMWFGDVMRKYRDAHKCGDLSEVPLCQGCYMTRELPPVLVNEFGYRAMRSRSATVYRKEFN